MEDQAYDAEAVAKRAQELGQIEGGRISEPPVDGDDPLVKAKAVWIGIEDRRVSP